MLLADLVAVSAAVGATRSRLAKIDALADTLRRLSPTEAPIALSYLSGRPTQERLGVGYATVHAVETAPAPEPSLGIEEVDEILSQVAAVSGPGSKVRREELLTELFAAATAGEQEFLRGLILRNLRQGALEGIMADAVAAALDVEPRRVRRAAMVSGDLVAVSSAALAEGPETLDRYSLAPLTPVQPMLAKTADSAAEAVAAIGEAVVEWKLDGARVQVHRDGDRIAVFTRNLRDVTDRVPEIVNVTRELPLRSVILDGEALLLGVDGGPAAFQDSMSRFGTDEGTRDERELAVFFFDCLHRDGIDLIDEPLTERRAALAGAVPEELLIGSVVASDPDTAERFFDEAVAAGHEGVMVKDPESSYEAGRRGAAWLKVKPTHTLDLVVLAAEWGSGRRQGWLSNLHLGARDPVTGSYVMLGKTFKGLTDEMLAWQTERFLELERERRGHVVHLEPEIVYEIAFDGVQRSSRYPGGVTLRFARVKRYRDDKGPSDADTIDTVRSFA